YEPKFNIMTQAKFDRPRKRQLGQFLTPPSLANEIVSKIQIQASDKVLEPGCGDGSFLIPIIQKYIDYGLDLATILNTRVWGVNIDAEVYNCCIDYIQRHFGPLPSAHNIVNGDFFHWTVSDRFDHIIGNPPFGGSINALDQDMLDKKYGI